MKARSFLFTTAFAVFACVSGAQAETFNLALWGDMPYAKANDGPKIPALIADMNAAPIAFSLYDGDIKDGSSKCTDDVYQAAIAMFNSMKAPTFYLPGDNEWTDCHRTNNGGYDNLERLDHLRKVMYTSADSFGQTKMTPERQGAVGAKFVENYRFEKAGVMFVGLNVPGSNNNKVNDEKSCTNKSARTQVQCDADNAEFAERNAANLTWMQESFAKATANKAAGIMIVIQGDPGFDVPETEEDDESRLPGKDGYAAFLDKLIEFTKAYSGQVVLVHGDTHFFKMDKPLVNYTTLQSNFTRLQTFGSPNVHWVKVEVDATSRQVFTFTPMIVAGN
jgi:hypothetical protein